MSYFTASTDDAATAKGATPSASGLGVDRTDGLNIVIVGAGIAGLAAALGLRQQGHHVTVQQILEGSTLLEEDGASIDLFPYANGVLRRFGVFAEDFGESRGITPCNGFTEFDPAGNRKVHVDHAKTSTLWQHPWYRVAPTALRDALRTAATSTKGPGVPAVIKLHCHVVQVDPVEGSITLEGGEQVHGDIVVGADGIQSKLRAAVVGTNEELHEIVGSSYSFYLERATLASHATLAKYVKDDGQSFSWVGKDGRLGLYPLSNNTQVNVLVTTCPSSQADRVSEGWRSPGNKSTLVTQFADFHADVQEIVALADESSLQVWNLYEVPRTFAWHNEKLIVIGDAAHTFGSLRAHSAGQALDDAAALAALLPAVTAPDKVSNALEFYHEFRKQRLGKITEYQRSIGLQQESSSILDEESGLEQLTSYLFGHDAWDAARQAGQRYFIKHNRKNWLRQPIQLGLYPSLRQHASGKLRRPQNHVKWTRYGVRFRTSRTVLDGFLPERFSFRSPGSVAEASWISGWTDGMDWLGGAGYHHTALMLHNVDYTKKDGEVIPGMYMVMMIEDQTDAILGGHDDSGMSKLYCEIDFRRIDDKAVMTFSWRGKTFVEIGLKGLGPPGAVAATSAAAATSRTPEPPRPAETGIFYERYVSAVGRPGVADAQYPVFASFKSNSGAEVKTTKMELATDGSVTYYKGDELTLPTWHGYVDRFAEMPFYGFVSGFAMEGTGVDDNRGTMRIE